METDSLVLYVAASSQLPFPVLDRSLELAIESEC